VTIADPKLGFSESIPRLEVGSIERFYPISYVVKESDPPGPVHNTAAADSDETDPVSAGCDVLVAAISINKLGPDTMTIGQSVQYTITVKNDGSLILNNVAVSDPKLGVNWAVGMLAIGATAQQTFAYVVKSEDIPGPLLNVVTVTATEIGQGPSDDWDSPLRPVLAGNHRQPGFGTLQRRRREDQPQRQSHLYFTQSPDQGGGFWGEAADTALWPGPIQGLRQRQRSIRRYLHDLALLPSRQTDLHGRRLRHSRSDQLSLQPLNR